MRDQDTRALNDVVGRIAIAIVAVAVGLLIGATIVGILP